MLRLWDTSALVVVMAAFAGLTCAISRGEDDRARQGLAIVPFFSGHLRQTAVSCIVYRFVPDPATQFSPRIKWAHLLPVPFP